MNAIQEAIIFATIKHQNQKRKGTDIPYIVHPMEVMQILTSMNCKERKQATIDHLEKASVETKLVCFADKLSNIRSMYRDKLQIGADLWKRFNASKEDIEWYYREILRAIRLGEFCYNGYVEGHAFVCLICEFEDTINAVFAE